MKLTRRTVMMTAAAAPLGACGFQPVYMPSAGGESGVSERELSAIYVALIPDRPGQLLRQALQQRFGGAGDPTPPLYTLIVGYWIAGEGIGIQPDSVATYIRLTATANWSLRGRDPAQTPVTSGYARAHSGINILDEQYFAGDLENDQAAQYFANDIADQISLRLATFFRNKAGQSATG
jgi:LPS-assembly lipoprotein